MSVTLEYIRACPTKHQKILREMRGIIKSAAPKAEEGISYGMPCFRQDRVLVWFKLYKNHLGFYPTGGCIRAFEEQLTDYHYSKGAVQFPLDRPLPKRLITRMVKFRVQENDLKRKKNAARG